MKNDVIKRPVLTFPTISLRNQLNIYSIKKGLKNPAKNGLIAFLIQKFLPTYIMGECGNLSKMKMDHLSFVLT